MPNLYPTVELPTLISPRTSTTKKSYVAPNFDFEAGEFILDSAGRAVFADAKTTFENWCIKACLTERGTKIAYSTDYGAELEAATKFNNSGAIQSMIIKTITETILAHPKAEYVKNFYFEQEGDNLRVTFDVKGKNFEETTLTVTY